MATGTSPSECAVCSYYGIHAASQMYSNYASTQQLATS
jgi:hypothetical protein